MESQTKKARIEKLVDGATTDTQLQDDVITESKENCKKPCETAIDGTFAKFVFKPVPLNEYDAWKFMHDNKSGVVDILQDEIKTRNGVIWYMCVHLKIYKNEIKNEENVLTQSELYRRCKCVTSLNGDSLFDQVEIAFETISSMINAFEILGSSWIIDKIVALDFNIASYKPIVGK
jgi:hypothetical protein